MEVTCSSAHRGQVDTDATDDNGYAAVVWGKQHSGRDYSRPDSACLCDRGSFHIAQATFTGRDGAPALPDLLFQEKVEVWIFILNLPNELGWLLSTCSTVQVCVRWPVLHIFGLPQSHGPLPGKHLTFRNGHKWEGSRGRLNLSRPLTSLAPKIICALSLSRI